MILHIKLNTVSSSCWYSLKKLLSAKRCTAFSKCFATVAQPQSNIDQNECDRIAKLLGVSEDEAQKIITEVPGILSRDEDNIKNTLQTLKKLNYPETVKIQYPKILLVGYARLENHFLIFQESGIHVAKTNPIPLTQYYTFKKYIIKRLKRRVISRNFDVVQSYIKTLNINEKDAAELYAWLPKDPELLTLEELRLKVMVYYLSKSWDCRTKISERLIKDSPLTYHRSLTWIRQLTEILKNQFQMPFQKVCGTKELLNCKPQKILEMYETTKKLGDAPTAEVVNKYPILLRNNKTDKLKKMNSFLIQNNIPPRSLARFPSIYMLSLDTVKKRVAELKENPILEPYSSHPRVTYLLYYQSRFKSRWDELKGKNLVSQMTLARILNNSKLYNKFLSIGLKASGADVLTTLHQLLPDKTKPELRNRISRNPHWMNASTIQIRETFQYLSTFSNVTTESIFQCLPILLYPIAAIEESWKVTLDSGEAKLEDPYFIAMVMYFIEKRWNFSGDGIWEVNVSDAFIKELESEVHKGEEMGSVILDDYELQRYKETDSVAHDEGEEEEVEIVEDLYYPDSGTEMK